MSAETFRKLAALGLTTEQIAGVLELMDEAAAEADARDEARKADARERWHRWNNKRKANVSKREQTLANNSREGMTRVEDNLQTKNLAGEKGKEEKIAPAALSSFPDFWSLYPNKVGKRDAQGAFLKALKRADPETILAGLRRYVAKTDDRPWCNPATWLNQDRWEDAPASVAPASRATAPPGRRMNAVEAYLSLKSEQRHEPAGRTIDHRNDERVFPDEPGLQALVGDLGAAMRWPDGSGHH